MSADLPRLAQTCLAQLPIACSQYSLRCGSDAVAMWLRCDCDAEGAMPGLEILPLKSPRQDEGVSCCVLGAMSSILVIRFGETIIGTNAVWFYGLQLHCKGFGNLVT